MKGAATTMTCWSPGFCERNRVQQVRLAELTTMRIGGPATQVMLEDERDLTELVAAGPRWLGRGANLLADDGELGLVASLGEQFARLEARPDGDQMRVSVGGACDLSKLVAHCARNGYAGPEGLAGVPASVGGALAMNAGTATIWMLTMVDRLRALLPGADTPRWFGRAEVPAGYRSSGLPAGTVFLGCELLLDRDDPERLQARASELKQRKAATQPLTERSAGCIFKNPRPDLPAGMLIDQLGLKGSSVGAAQISPVHANFIVNRGGASAAEVLALIGRIRERAQAERGIELETEVKMWSAATNPLSEQR